MTIYRLFTLRLFNHYQQPQYGLGNALLVVMNGLTA